MALLEPKYPWPIAAMPVPLQWLAALIPTTPMMDAVTKLFAEGSSRGPVLADFRQYHAGCFAPAAYLANGGYA